MERHACKICSRRFPNGRALGGHMRSHLASYAAARKPARPFVLQSGDSSASSASGELAAMPPLVKGKRGKEAVEEEDEMKVPAEVSYRLRENPRKSFRLVDPEFASHFAAAAEPAGSYVVDQYGQSETESSRAALANRRLLKRPRRTVAAAPPPPPPPPPHRPSSSPEPASSFSGTTTDEDVALCLMMLSRDSRSIKPEVEEEEQLEVDHQPASDGSVYEADRRIAVPTPLSQRSRSRFECETCMKVFRSYQALGGHRASYKKTGLECVRPPATPAVTGRENKKHYQEHAKNNEGAKVHECPFCFRVFESGQALGGHKRAHFVACSTAITTKALYSPPQASPPPPPPPQSLTPSTSTAHEAANAAAAATATRRCFDLNLPAPMDEEVEQSVVSDPTSI